MDQIKIGKFIAERRKSLGLTQMQLAEKLNITDRAISKWECGRSMPDSSIMLELCAILDITVNDLLSGETVTLDDYNKELERKLLELIKEKEKADKHLLMFETVIGVLSLIILLAPIFFGAYFPMEDWQRIVVIFSGFIPAIVGFSFAMRIEQVAGYYECQCCGHKYVPKYMTLYMSPHVGRTRKMKCPKCGERSWQKKVISKD